MSPLSVHRFFFLVLEDEQLKTAILRQSCRGASTLNKEWEAVCHSFIRLHICVDSVQPEAGLFGNGALNTFQWRVSGAWQEWSAGERQPNTSSSFSAWQPAVNSEQQLPPPSPQICYKYLASLIYTGFPNSNKSHQPCLREIKKTKATLGRHCQNPHKLKSNLIWVEGNFKVIKSSRFEFGWFVVAFPPPLPPPPNGLKPNNNNKIHPVFASPANVPWWNHELLIDVLFCM